MVDERMMSKILRYLMMSKFQATKEFRHHSHIFPTCRKIQSEG